MDISEKLKRCRKQMGLTQSEVADRLNVSRKTVSGWETGRSYPDIKMLTQLAKLFGVSLDILLDDEKTLDHYEEQEQLGENSFRIFKWSYALTSVLLVLGYVDVFRPGGFHTIVIPIALLVSLLVLLTHFGGWHEFKKWRHALSYLLVIVLIFIATFWLVSLTPNFLKVVSEFGTFENAGFILARIILIGLLSISFTSLIFMWPKKR